MLNRLSICLKMILIYSKKFYSYKYILKIYYKNFYKILRIDFIDL